MDYRELTPNHRADILRERLQTLEGHHYRLILDMNDAEGVGDDATLAHLIPKRHVLEHQIENVRALLDATEPKGKQ